MADSDRQIQSFVIFDLETTGLPVQKPKITELCFLGLNRRDLTGVKPVPRVINKLLLFADPGKRIDPEAAAITGLDNELLADQTKFNHDLVRLLSIFLDRLPKPVCLVAHNGDRFDYPLLITELQQAEGDLPVDLRCVDTLTAVKQLEVTEGKVSYKLENIYKRCFGEAPPICHTAEDDCMTLLKVVKKFSPSFVDWADKNAKSFRELPPMYKSEDA